MPTIAFEHVHLRSPNPRAAADYYIEMFGASVLDSLYPPSDPRIALSLGGTVLLIGAIEAGAPSAPVMPFVGIEHIGLRVTDIDTLARDMKRKGAVFLVEPETRRPGLRVAFIRGPDNVCIELLERDAAR